MDEITLLDDFSSLPRGITVALYGTGHFGETILNALKNRRPDINVEFLLDSYSTGSKFGKQIITPDSLQSYGKRETDLILITSIYVDEIRDTLYRYGHKNMMAVSQDLLYRLYLDTPDVLSDIAKARSLFESENERYLYDLLIMARREKTPVLREYNKTYNINIVDQYMDFIDFSRVRTVIDAGVFDGYSVLAFSKKMGGSGKVIGFDPFPECYDVSPHRRYIDNIFDVEFHPFALWNENTRVNFHLDSLLPSDSIGSSCVVDEGDKINCRYVKAVRLDDFVRQRCISSVDLIKMDIEGAEPEALEGAIEVIRKFRPQLAISIYHKPEHLYEIPNWISSMLDNYSYHIEHYSPEVWETVFYAIPV